MPKSSKQALENALASRSPAGQRQAIVPVNILEEATLPPSIPDAESEREKSSERANGENERKERTERASKKAVRYRRTERTNESTERRKRTILMEPEKPETVRDSYEAYVDQLETIETLQALYRKKTGRPLTKSRVIREALAFFLPKALDAYKDERR